MYRWMLNNRIFGKYLKNYYERKRVSIKVKIGTISFLWIILGISIFIVKLSMIANILLIIVGIIVSTHILLIGVKRI